MLRPDAVPTRIDTISDVTVWTGAAWRPHTDV
jgi:5-methylthioadenosine/S-adenosylhomocysteine deaminase